MLDTCICSYIMRERPLSLLERLSVEVEQNNRIVISAITYAEMRYGQIGRKASARHKSLVDAFISRLNAVLPWDMGAVDAAVDVKTQLSRIGLLIGPNDIAIAGHAISTACILVTHNTREFARVDGLCWEDWV